MLTYKPQVCRTCNQAYTRLRGADACPHCTTPRPCKDCGLAYHNRDIHTLRCASCIEARKTSQTPPPVRALKRIHTFNPDNLNSFYFSHHENEERKRKLYRRLFGA